MKIDREMFLELIERVFGIKEAFVSTVCCNYFDLVPGFRLVLVFPSPGDILIKVGGHNFEIPEKVITSLKLDGDEYAGPAVQSPCLRFICHESIMFELRNTACELEDYQNLMNVCCKYNFLQMLKEMDEAEEAYDCSGTID